MNFTPGQRISNRGEDFIINDVEENNGSWILKVEGISELKLNYLSIKILSTITIKPLFLSIR
ncbi:MAG: hypothetical protein BGO29_12655 [Bacteroidales bacterium 36-12]|nr:MAG: hypothetical protein BGO29_12655 [Bacteroidales bacterium 36-12]